MRPSVRCLKALERIQLRHKSTSFIGLGRMGHEMALNLFSKQFTNDVEAHFVVCDAIPDSARAFAEKFLGQFPAAKIAIASTPEEAVLGSQTVVTMLPSSPEVKTVYSHILPILQQLPSAEARSTICIDSTTLDVSVAKRVAADVINTGAEMVDAPVSGGVTGAKAGTLSFLVGGSEAAFKHSESILSLMGQRIIHCGDSGSGLGAKICNNVSETRIDMYTGMLSVVNGVQLVLGVQQIVVGEAMLLGQRLGLEPAVLAGVINSSTGGCWASSVNNPVPAALAGKSPPCERDYEGGFATALMLKDMGLAKDVAKQYTSPIPLGEAAEEMYRRVIKEQPELARKDFSSPSAIIFGGLNTCSRALTALLVPVDGDPLISHLRIVDKFSVVPPTTYIGKEFPKILANPLVEYKQANLTVPATVASCFVPSEGQPPYDYVFDYTGEVRHDRTEMIQINTTLNVARLIGLEAAKLKVKAYVRMQQPFYDTGSSSKATHSEKEDIKPVDTLGIWWHETLRVLAAIDDLNLVILRSGFVYGPYTNYGIVASGITVGSVYGFLKKPMKSMWSPGKNPNNTVHIDDVAGAAWACAEWVAPLGRAEANTLAGEEILFHNDKKKVKEVQGMPSHDQKLIAPLFNLVDESNSTLLSIGEAVTSYFGTTFDFFTFVESTALKASSGVLRDVHLTGDHVEDINEHHVGGWTEMLTISKPPIPNTPLSAYMDSFALSKHIVAFNNTKIKEIVGYKLKRPLFNHETIKEVVDKWKDENTYELLPPSSGTAEQQQALMGQEEQILKPEGRQGDLLAAWTALVLVIVTWTAILSRDPLGAGWFAFHPTLQTLALALFTYGIVTLQPTSQPKTKAAGFTRHQAAMFFVGFPAILLGTSAIAYNKWIHNTEHMTTWHGTFGYLTIIWIITQVALGGGSVWFKGAAFGGGAKAKALWKYHRLSGYLLFPTLLFTAHLGGAWSHWGERAIPSPLQFVAYTLAPLLIVIGIVTRVRPSKMKFLP
ncbi:hypothetical protein DXG01_015108 [Tephrocybe rancida]|nr:hypothetical protein DXG01_015108 [Tephrocybe rancida]